jgi:hypothetical protein
MRFLRLMLVLLFAVVALIPATNAQAIEISDYIGNAWETNGFPPNPGDAMQFVGVSNFMDPITGVDLAAEEVTYYVYGLTCVSVSSNDPDLGYTTYYYTGGTLEVYRDAAKNAAYGTNPPNGTVPSTFTDGTLLLQGAFTSFAITINPFGGGSYGGAADGISGELITSCAGCIYTWGGSWTSDVGAQIPDGYDLQLDGILDIDSAVPAPSTDWGIIKSQFGSR